ncbi:MAG: hypothetical protein WC992_06745 [Acholeplasmataceae bacterium]
MEVAHIIPPQWADKFTGTQTYMMALAQWVMPNPNYAEWLRRQKGYKILDNGAFEGEQCHVYTLDRAALEIEADEVVLPDVPGDPVATLELSWKSYKELQHRRVMFVPQGKNPEEWKRCLDKWLEVWGRRGNYLSIGVSSLRDKDGKPVYGSKSETVTYACTSGYPVHILGMTSPKYVVEELIPLALEAGVRGIDTSTAFALGSRDILLTPDTEKVRLGDIEQYRGLSTCSRRLVYLNRNILDYWFATGDCQSGIPERLIRETASRWLKYWNKGFQTLIACMSACGLPKGRYAYDGTYVRQMAKGERAKSDVEVLEL